MHNFRLVTLGVGDAFSRRSYSSCLALEAEGSWLLIDCPHPIRKIMCEASRSTGLELDLPSISAVVLTHLHADHVSGLEGVALYNRFLLGHTTRLLAHPSVSEQLWDGHLSAGMRWVVREPGQAPAERFFEDFFDLIPLSETAAVQLGPFAVRCRPTLHSVPTTALFIEAAGRSLGYSADTAFDPGLIAWLAAADLIVHEADGGFLHTPYEQLARLPAAVQSKLRLIHCPDNFDASTSAIEVLQQGRCYVV